MNNSFAVDKNERNLSVDGLRGIVAIVIAMFHFERIFPFNEKWFATGYLGVEFFFVLSGYLLAFKLIDKEKNTINIKDIMKMRIVKLYPLYLFGIVSVAILQSVRWANGNIFEWLNSTQTLKMEIFTEIMMAQMTGISNFQMVNYPGWYVSALIIVTILVVICIKYFKAIFTKILAPLTTIVIYIVLIKKYGKLDINAGFTYFICTGLLRAWAGICLGIILYNIYHGLLKNRIKCLNKVYVNVIQIVLIIWFMICLIGREPSKMDIIIIFPVCGLILMLFETRGVVSTILNMRVFKFMGKISYSFYICQSFSMGFVECFFRDTMQPFATVIFLIINIFLSFYVDRVFYKIRKYKKRENEVERNLSTL